MVNQDSISHLIQNRGSDAMATTYTEADFPQPTFCIFEYACNSILNDNFRNENYSLSSILKKIKYKAIAPVDPEILTNINHPDSRF